MSELIKNLSSADFDSSVSSGTVLVDFWAAWCGPCKAIAPILDDLAKELSGKLTIAKVDVDAHPDLAAKFEVQAIPTLLVFKDGKLANRIVGMVNKASLSSKIAPFL